MIAIIDYGTGNLGSILNMLRKIGAEAVISADPEVIRGAGKLILPGVGAFDTGMSNLQRMGIIPLLEEKVLVRKTPFLSICLGMQLLAEGSEEGSLAGLGWIEARAERFKFPDGAGALKVPHMGWNTVEIRKESPLLVGLGPEPRFYFVHSFHVVCRRPEDVLTTTRYGGEFTSAFQKGHILGVQFHPEKSHKFGLRLLSNFAALEE